MGIEFLINILISPVSNVTTRQQNIHNGAGKNDTYVT